MVQDKIMVELVELVESVELVELGKALTTRFQAPAWECNRIFRVFRVFGGY